MEQSEQNVHCISDRAIVGAHVPWRRLMLLKARFYKEFLSGFKLVIATLESGIDVAP